MHRPDPFEARVRAAVRTLADDADTRVDAVAVAERARRMGREANRVWLGRWVAVAAAFVVVAVAILGWLEFRQGLVGPAATPTPTPTPAATSMAPVPTATFLDHSGWTFFSATQTLTVVSPGTTDPAGHTTGIAIATVDRAPTPRASGNGRFTLESDRSGDLLVEWGTYQLDTSLGSWQGTCRGTAENDARELTCWLAGSGGYAGFTYTFNLRASGNAGEIQGLIYPGSPPEP